MKGFMIAGVSSGIGKTTVSMGLMSLFENVSPFKVGPDYIDTTFHQFVTGNKSYNLDLFMMGEEGVKYSFYKHHKGISIVEGVMGLYDGIDHSLDNNSSAHLARVLDLPVILIVSGGGKSTSIAAEVLGYKMLDSRVKIASVIINRTTEAMYKHYKEAIEKYTGVECIGYLPKDESLSVSSRHLGLLQAEEIDGLREKSKHLKEILQKTIDVERLLEIAELGEKDGIKNPFEELKDKYKGLKVGIAKDKAFSFYYNDNLELMEDLGMELIPFSPMSDKEIPEVDLLYFGGGYPENYAKELSSNIEMIESIREYHQKGGKIYGECGGFMYLTSRIKLLDGKYFPMCDIIKCSVEMRDRLDISRFGYISLYDKEKTLGRGHEFHYSKISDIKDDSREYRAIKPNGKEWACVFKEKNCRAGYPHIHFFKSLDYLYEIIKGNR
ncbi:cobyrinate a,c-diamide synthase [uncultured Fusobacterium sp.]|jgi:cobyrinic acid a,c-diamide synthase|uniref:cobyrinate a,c-diamide synthase n=1 Tax=uncultured Fusobacterium sp. TaxID=159267 RepID=UPI0025E07665|nr:cobyrinate a,c-diamide synthase [uncultured Fusobacterium sp.]